MKQLRHLSEETGMVHKLFYLLSTMKFLFSVSAPSPVNRRHRGHYSETQYYGSSCGDGEWRAGYNCVSLAALCFLFVHLFPTILVTQWRKRTVTVVEGWRQIGQLSPPPKLHIGRFLPQISLAAVNKYGGSLRDGRFRPWKAKLCVFENSNRNLYDMNLTKMLILCNKTYPFSSVYSYRASTNFSFRPEANASKKRRTARSKNWWPSHRACWWECAHHMPYIWNSSSYS